MRLRETSVERAARFEARTVRAWERGPATVRCEAVETEYPLILDAYAAALALADSGKRAEILFSGDVIGTIDDRWETHHGPLLGLEAGRARREYLGALFAEGV